MLTGMHDACVGGRYLEKIWDIFLFKAHGLGATEGGVGRHMDPLLLAPVDCSVIAPVAMHLHLQHNSALLTWLAASLHNRNLHRNGCFTACVMYRMTGWPSHSFQHISDRQTQHK